MVGYNGSCKPNNIICGRNNPDPRSTAADLLWDGDIEAAFRYQLGPSGISLEALRAQPGGVQVPLKNRYRKYAEQENGFARGFRTPTRKIELYSETMLLNGYPPLLEFVEPLVSPVSRPDLAEHYPLILTCAKNTLFY